MTAQTSEPIPKTQKAAVSDSATSGTTIKEVPVVQPEQLGPGAYFGLGAARCFGE